MLRAIGNRISITRPDGFRFLAGGSPALARAGAFGTLERLEDILQGILRQAWTTIRYGNLMWSFCLSPEMVMSPAPPA